MRCAIDFDENKLLIEQEVRAWGEMQSLKEEPAYKESNIKNETNRAYFLGYKAALDDVCNALDNLVIDGVITNEISDEIQSWMSGDLCMNLFSILDDEYVDEYEHAEAGQMKKAMISQPMNGLTDKEIEEARNRAMAYLKSQGYEVVNTLFTDEWYSSENMKKRGVKNIPLCFLAKSIENMCLCDTVYFCSGWDTARGCIIEYDCAKAYGLKMIFESETRDEDCEKAEK